MTYFFVLIISIVLLCLTFIAFSVKVLLVKNGVFPPTSVGRNKALNRKGIYCPKTQQKIIDKNLAKNMKTNPESCKHCGLDC